MKTSIYITVIIILITLFQCESTFETDEHPQTDEHPEMDIKPINIELVGLGLDTLLYDLPYVWIVKTDSNETGFTANIDETWVLDTLYGGITDIFYEIRVHDNSMIMVFNKDDLIDGSGNWVSPDNNSFEYFKGQGQKYIAYLIGIQGHNGINYKYGWINVYYSASGDTLKILELATSREYNVSIKAGKK